MPNFTIISVFFIITSHIVAFQLQQFSLARAAAEAGAGPFPLLTSINPYFATYHVLV